MLKKLYHWMGKKVHTPYATPFLALLFFVEAIFFVPVDPILIIFCLERPKQSLWYATVATASSVIGGIVGYMIGLALWNSAGPAILQSSFVSSIMSQKTFNYLSQQYNIYSHWAILILGFTPLPYKAATLSAGFCNIALLPFVCFSVIARGARFFLIGFTIKIWGIQIKQFIDRYFNILVTLTIVVITLLFLIFKN